MHGNSIGIRAVISLVLLYGTSALPTDGIVNGDIKHEDNIAEESNTPSRSSEDHRVPAPSELPAGPHFALAIIQPPPLHVPQSVADNVTKSEGEELQPPAVVVLITGRDDEEAATPDKTIIKELPTDEAGNSPEHIRQTSGLGLAVSSGGSPGTTAAGASEPGKTVTGSTTVLQGEAAAAEREAAQKAAQAAVQEALGGANKANVADLISSALKDLRALGQVEREADEDQDKGSVEKESGEEEKPDIPLLPFVPGGPPPEVEKPESEEEIEEEEEEPAKPPATGEKVTPGAGGLVVPPGSEAGLITAEGVEPQPGVSPPLVSGEGEGPAVIPGIHPGPGNLNPPQVPSVVGQGELPQLHPEAGNVEIPVVPPVTRPDLSGYGNVNIPPRPSIEMEGLRPDFERPNFAPGYPGSEVVPVFTLEGEIPPIGVPEQPLQPGSVPPQQPIPLEILPQQPTYPQIPTEQLPINPEIPPQQPTYPQIPTEQLPINPEIPPQQPTFPQVPIQQQPQVLLPEQPIQVLPEQPVGLPPQLPPQPLPPQGIPQELPQQPVYNGAVGIPIAEGIPSVPQGVQISQPFPQQVLGGQPPQLISGAPFGQEQAGPLAQAGTPGQLITGLPSSIVQPGGEQVILPGYYPGIGSSRPIWTPEQYLDETFGAIREVPNFRLIPVKAVRLVGTRPLHDVSAKGKRNYRADPILAGRTRDVVAYRGYSIPRYFAIIPTY